MTPQERAAVVKLYEKILSYSPDQEALEAGDDKDFEAIRQALTETRRAALLGCRDEINKLVGKDSGNWNRAIVYAVDAIDRLAQEGS